MSVVVNVCFALLEMICNWPVTNYLQQFCSNQCGVKTGGHKPGKPGNLETWHTEGIL